MGKAISHRPWGEPSVEHGVMTASRPIWPDGCLGALSLTFDDGMKSQLEVALPLLNRFGFRATFYLNPRGEDWRELLEPWHEVAAAGHEIGNHTLSHPCSSNFSGDPNGPGLESMSPKDVEDDILKAQRRLDEAFPSPRGRSFCYPCYQAFVGRGRKRQSYVPIVAKYFMAARGWGEVANHPAACDLLYLSSWPVERTSGPELVGLAERTTGGRWGILTLHGIQQGHLPVADVDFQELVEFLGKNGNRIWVAPVIEVAMRIIEWRKETGSDV